jgi:hypothetical protein
MNLVVTGDKINIQLLVFLNINNELLKIKKNPNYDSHKNSKIFRNKLN